MNTATGNHTGSRVTRCIHFVLNIVHILTLPHGAHAAGDFHLTFGSPSDTAPGTVYVSDYSPMLCLAFKTANV